jgi:hypothetical protein
MLKNFFAILGFLIILVFSVLVGVGHFKYDLFTKISQVRQLEKDALSEYIKMFKIVLETGDPAKGMVLKRKLIIPEGATKATTFEAAVNLMDEIANEHGLANISQKTMPRDGKLFKDGGKLTHIRSYCSPAIADKFLTHSGEFVGFMPCRIAFVEDDRGDIYVYTMSMELLIHGGYPLSETLLFYANEVRAAMYEMLLKGSRPDVDIEDTPPGK